VGLLGTLEVLATVANPLLRLKKQSGKLQANFLRQELDEGDTQQQVELDLFFRIWRESARFAIVRGAGASTRRFPAP